MCDPASNGLIFKIRGKGPGPPGGSLSRSRKKMSHHCLKSLLGAQIFDFSVKALCKTNFKGVRYWPCGRIRGCLGKEKE